MELTIRWHERFLRQQGGHDGRLLDEWHRLIHPGTEYKFVIRHVFELRGDPRLAKKDRLDFKEYNWPKEGSHA
jgi:hypothetical protein